MARLKSVKRFFLLDQGDFLNQFIDLADDELKMPLSDITRDGFSIEFFHFRGMRKFRVLRFTVEKLSEIMRFAKIVFENSDKLEIGSSVGDFDSNFSCRQGSL